MPHHFKCVPSSLFVLFCDEEDLLLGATPDQTHKGLVHCDGSVGGDGGEREPEDHLLVLVSCKPVLVGGRVAQSAEREWRRWGRKMHTQKCMGGPHHTFYKLRASVKTAHVPLQKQPTQLTHV